MSRLVAKAKDPSFNIRVPLELLKQIDQRAAGAGRSRNSEIIVLLQSAIVDDEEGQTRATGTG